VTARQINKRKVLEALHARVQETLATLTASQKTIQSGAVHEETRQEDPKDTRAIEAGYLARGLAERVETLKETIAALRALRLRSFGPEDPVALTAIVALVTLDVPDAEETLYFLVPSAGGERLMIDDVTLHSVTPGSPVGRELVGRTVDDEVEVELPGGLRKATIAWAL
jgi:transcription elongation GreA/GreB family factor